MLVIKGSVCTSFLTQSQKDPSADKELNLRYNSCGFPLAFCSIAFCYAGGKKRKEKKKKGKKKNGNEGACVGKISPCKSQGGHGGRTCWEWRREEG